MILPPASSSAISRWCRSSTRKSTTACLLVDQLPAPGRILCHAFGTHLRCWQFRFRLCLCSSLPHLEPWVSVFRSFETTGNYWIYNNGSIRNFGATGIWRLCRKSGQRQIHPPARREDGFTFLPDFALGWNDFHGHLQVDRLLCRGNARISLLQL